MTKRSSTYVNKKGNYVTAYGRNYDSAVLLDIPSFCLNCRRSSDKVVTWQVDRQLLIPMIVQPSQVQQDGGGKKYYQMVITITSILTLSVVFSDGERL